MKTKVHLAFLVASIFFLSACTNATTSPPPVTGKYILATSRSNSAATKVSKNLPSHPSIPITNVKASRLTGISAIDAANQKSTRQANSKEYLNSTMTFNYIAGELYQIYCAPLRVTDVQLQMGEHIVAIGAGDTVRWQVSKTYSGAGGMRIEHLLIKPVEEDLTNSLVITTDMRTYHLLLTATAKTYMASVAWNYPDNDEIVHNFVDQEATSPASLNLNKLDFNYNITIPKGSKFDWQPQMVFNDGSKTYFEFSPRMQEAPTLFVGTLTDNQVVNYRVEGNYYIVDRIIDQAQLRCGQNNDFVILITHTK